MAKFYIFFLLTVTLLSSNSKAQIAIVNSQKIISSMPVFKKIDSLVNVENERYTLEYNKKQVLANRYFEIADSLYKIDQKASSTIKAVNDSQTADKDLKTFSETANKKVAEYRQFLEQPHIEKIMAVIKTIAINRKLLQVIDKKSIELLYGDANYDITDDVIKQLKK